MVKDFAQLIGSWPQDEGRTSIRTFASDMGIPYGTAQVMRSRSSVASDYWPQIVTAGKKRGLDWLTIEVLAQFRKHRKRWRSRPSRREGTRQAA